MNGELNIAMLRLIESEVNRDAFWIKYQDIERQFSEGQITKEAFLWSVGNLNEIIENYYAIKFMAGYSGVCTLEELEQPSTWFSTTVFPPFIDKSCPDWENQKDFVLDFNKSNLPKFLMAIPGLGIIFIILIPILQKRHTNKQKEEFEQFKRVYAPQEEFIKSSKAEYQKFLKSLEASQRADELRAAEASGFELGVQYGYQQGRHHSSGEASNDPEVESTVSALVGMVVASEDAHQPQPVDQQQAQQPAETTRQAEVVSLLDSRSERAQIEEELRKITEVINLITADPGLSATPGTSHQASSNANGEAKIPPVVAVVTSHAPPAPPAPPPPPQLPEVSGGRKALLAEIQKGKELKKTITIDKSAPVLTQELKPKPNPAQIIFDNMMNNKVLSQTLEESSIFKMRRAATQGASSEVESDSDSDDFFDASSALIRLS